MSRLFDDAQNEYLTHAVAVKNATPFAMVCWFNSNDATIQQSLMAIGDADNNANYFVMFLRGNVAGDYLYADLAAQGSGTAAVTTTGYSTGTWHHACAIYASSTDRRALIDGGSKGTDAVNKTPTAGNLDTTSIGVLDRLNDFGPMSGMIAEAAIYDLSVYPGATDSDKADYFETNVLPGLVKKFSPLFYPLGLKAYWPLIRGINDEVGGYNMTASGSVAAAHPNIIQPCGVL